MAFSERAFTIQLRLLLCIIHCCDAPAKKHCGGKTKSPIYIRMAICMSFFCHSFVSLFTSTGRLGDGGGRRMGVKGADFWNKCKMIHFINKSLSHV